MSTCGTHNGHYGRADVTNLPTPVGRAVGFYRLARKQNFSPPPLSKKKVVDPQKRHGRVLPARFFYSTFPGTQLHAGGSSCGSLQKLATKLNRAHRMESNETLMLPGSPIETQRYGAHKRQQTKDMVLQVITSEKVCGPFKSSFFPTNSYRSSLVGWRNSRNPRDSSLGE